MQIIILITQTKNETKNNKNIIIINNSETQSKCSIKHNSKQANHQTNTKINNSREQNNKQAQKYGKQT